MVSPISFLSASTGIGSTRVAGLGPAIGVGCRFHSSNLKKPMRSPSGLLVDPWVIDGDLHDDIGGHG